MTNNTQAQAQPRARIRQLKLGDTARLELEAHRVVLTERIVKLSDEMHECEIALGAIIAILGGNVPTTTTIASPFGTPTRVSVPTNARAAGYSKRDPNPNESTILALDAAGRAGITSRELSEVTQVPSGTASARLSQLKKDGRVVHVGNRYYLPPFMPDGAKPLPMASYTRKRDALVVHSQQEDNNTTQGGEGIANHG